MNWTFWRLLFGIALVGSMGLELVGEPYAPEHVWDYALFFAVAGLLGCLILSFVAKGVMAPALDRPEDYYGEADADYDWSTESPAAEGDGSERSGASGGGGGRGEG